jgi:DNA-binding transcriptional LysR family regulator
MHGMNIAGMDLNLLVAFDALLRERSVTRAAARIGLSQPAMSHALRRLRALLDDELFLRTPAGMEPTPRALALSASITPALADLTRALAPVAPFDPATCTRRFSAGMIEYAEIALIAELAAELRRQAPRADLSVVPITRIDFVEQFDSGAIDVALGNLRRFPPHLTSAPLLEDRLVCIGRPRHPALARSLSLERYVRLVHVLVSPTGAPRGAVDDLLAKRGLTRRVAFTVGTYLALPLALAGTDLVATVPERVARVLVKMAGLALRPLPLDVSASVTLIWRRQDDGDPAQAWFRALLAASSRIANDRDGAIPPRKRKRTRASRN